MMKQYYFFLMAYFSLISAGPAEEFFLQGNRSFEQGDFSTAIEKYSAIEKPSGFVFFNMGVAYFNSEKYAQARLYFARVQKMGPVSLCLQAKAYDDRINERLNLLHEKTIVNRTAEYFKMIPLSWLQFLILICFLSLFYGLYQQKKFRAQRLIYLVLLFFIVIWVVRYKQNQSKQVVVMQQSDLYVGPNHSFLKKSVIPLGSLVFVKRQQEKMIEVVMHEEHGWIDSDNLTFV